MMPSPDFLAALQLIQGDALARRVFGLVSVRLGVSGWAIAKSLDQPPDKTEEALAKLRENGVLQSNGRGLEGNYALTGLGFTLKEQFGGNNANACIK